MSIEAVVLNHEHYIKQNGQQAQAELRRVTEYQPPLI